MKKALKYFMLALLLVPCALVFTACGSKAMSTREFAQFVYNAYNTHQATETYKDYKDFKITLESSQKMTTMQPLQYKETAEGDEKTENVEVPTEATTNIVIERTGKGKDTVLKITIKNSSKTTTQTVKEDQTLSGGKTIAINESTKTYYFGMNKANETEKYYVLLDSESVTKTSVDNTAYVNSNENASKTGKNFESEEAFQAAVEAAVSTINSNYFIPAYYSVAPDASTPFNISYEKNGKNVTAKAESAVPSLSVDSTPTYVEAGITVKFNDGKVVSLNNLACMEGYKQGKIELSSSINFEYTSSAKMLTEAEITAAEYDLSGCTYDLSQDLGAGLGGSFGQ